MKNINVFIITLLLLLPIVGQAQTKVAMLISGYGNTNEGKINYDLEELAQSYLVLTRNGVEVDIISPKGGSVPVHNKKDDLKYIQDFKKAALIKLQRTSSITEANTRNYHALMIIGGDGAMFDLPFDPNVQSFISKFANSNTPIAAVCHGPAALVNVKLENGEHFLSGKTVNSFTEKEEHAFSSELIDKFPFMLQPTLESRGARFVSNAPMLPFVVQDGNLITAQNPMSVAKATEALLLTLDITPASRPQFNDEATMALVNKARTEGAFLIDLALKQYPNKYDLNYLGIYGFYAYGLADTQAEKLTELKIMEIVGQHFSHPAYSHALIRALKEQNQADKAKVEKQKLLNRFPDIELPEDIKSI